jgi:hypothetical protein
MKMTVYEGTVEEIKELHRHLSAQSGAPVLTIALGANDSSRDEGDEGWRWASTDVAYRALTRRRLSTEQRSVILAIYRAHPDWILATDLQKMINYSPSQFAGLMGAFGRRFTHTEGFEEGMWFFDQEIDHAHSCIRYRMPASVRKAVERASLV